MYGNEIIQIFMVQLLISMQVNYKDEDSEVRSDAQKCMRCLAIIAAQFTSPKKHIYRQFDSLFSIIAMFYNKAKTDKSLNIEQEEIQGVLDLY